MLLKHETKSARVKGLAFHPKLSWVLASLHSGVIQLSDYRLGCLLEKFEGHIGPVRGIAFHSTQPLFVSGGDDHTVRVWNYKEKVCVFSLTGHLDYVRTVEFHNESPWICSASDDQTVRIWNWQSRQCLAVLAGHHHFVMCATFHQSRNLLASASLDQTVRLWDLTGLREKHTVAGVSSHQPSAGVDVFGISDVVCVFVVDGHDRGINWVSFHPTERMFVTASDDRTVRVWKFDDYKWWDYEVFRGHFNHVSCAMFHSRLNLVISDSEDRTIRIWDLAQKSLIHSFRRDSDRFWILDVQPRSNMIAAGHDSGFVVFKLLRERVPAVTWSESNRIMSLYVQREAGEIYFRGHCSEEALEADLSSAVNTKISDTETDEVEEAHKGLGFFSRTMVRKPQDAYTGHVYSLARNPLSTSEIAIALLYKAPPATGKGNFLLDLWTVPIPARTLALEESALSNISPTKCGTWRVNSFAFCGRARFAVLTAAHELKVYPVGSTPSDTDDQGKIVGNFEAFVPEALFYAGNNRVLIRGECGTMMLYDTSVRRPLQKLTLTIAGAQNQKGKVRQVVWNQKNSLVALLSNNYVCLASGDTLQHLTSLHECVKVKSGVWSDDNLFIYNTASHLKYLLPNGDRGIIRAIPERMAPLYLQYACQDRVFFYTRTSALYQLQVDLRDAHIKRALMQKDLVGVASLLRDRKMPGNAWIGYLQKSGYPEIAYQCERNPVTRAFLATEFADIDAATEAVKQVNTAPAWRRLGEVALKLGRLGTAETCFQKARRYKRLLWLYLMTANFTKLERLNGLLQEIGDHNTALNISLVCGAVQARVKALSSLGQHSLAYATAKMHLLDQLAIEPRQHLEPDVVKRIDMFVEARRGNARLLCPPLPVSSSQSADDWPLREAKTEDQDTTQMTGAFKILMGKAQASGPAQPASGVLESQEFRDTKEMDVADAWMSDENDWLPPRSGSLHETETKAPVTEVIDTFQPLVCDYVASGQFKAAISLLQKRIALKNVKPLVPLMRDAFQAVQAYMPTFPGFGSMPCPLRCPDDLKKLRRHFTMEKVEESIKKAEEQVFQREFESAHDLYLRALHEILFIETDQPLEEINKIVAKIASAILIVQLERVKTDLPLDADAKRLEASLLQCGCGDQPYRFLLLRDAAKTALRAKNFITGATIIHQILNENATAKNVSAANESVIKTLKSRVLPECENQGTNAVDLGFDVAEALKDAGSNVRICASTLTLIPTSEVVSKCPFCSAVVKKSSVTPTSNVCPVCQISEIGKPALGLVLSRP